ncbi:MULTISPECIES: hypothetical protein [Alcaligenes]|jgi:hypothetical protein|uniref:Integral membrane protein n=2 Tax=Alcaligenes TaxID=507 RepID=A0AB33CZ51_ALCFA|nr:MULTISPECIES: hypothetical protein [Alcaligenes]ASR91162.1 hypothetical protein AFA_17835 [Alcaligenes faecalis]AWG36173.1 hypothetical protein CA948_14120 [Alcaligenes aquatilis]MCC9164826.1 hypothetical protein [Alcaligenes sp. MMA]MCH4224833.1 hypothetical protein [Alcaligenes faecalis]QXR35849.1 hypothetical protein EGK70_018900 [Alcaligenes aquatilis]
MQSDVVLGAAHWAYLISVLVIIITMIFRANVVVPSVIGTLAVVTAITGSPIQGLISIFSASFVAAQELFNIFLVITFMTALLNSLKRLEADVKMVAPFRKVMVNSASSFLMIAAATYFISLFFWPTPAVPLVSAILLPAAIAAGLPPLVGAMAIAICGQGMALSSDYIIGVAPGISAKAAGVGADVAVLADRALVLSWITGGVALTLAFLLMRRHFKPADSRLLDAWMRQAPDSTLDDVESQGTYDKAEMARGTAGNEHTVHSGLSAKEERYSRILAWITPLAFLAVIGIMLLPRFIPSLPVLRGGDAAGLVGGVAFVLMMIATCMAEGPRRMLDTCPDHMTDGFVFAFRAMGSVLPIAGFFFLGASEATSAILGIPLAQTPSLLFELISAGQHLIPDNHFLVAFGVLLVGMISGIDGSGFSGLPLTGTLASALSPVSGLDIETLAAVGQIGAIWTGGGTLIAWSSLIAVAGFARVHVLDLVRALTVPVLTGMAISTICAVLVFG